ncbi:hypothetical protein [Wolbachia endosymbiont of Ctenocephalides felis wCfeT]|uniref:hypothetical protein n=1 Tax=Wolbachia endosymbiont of Ctenocephalides felis wCfeT TaxID=2732593 RepID=UPI001444DE54|nr:hypothetical protein [Wolbachia endosymbiont of Ctenocephalides felis wCfeT]
MQQSHFKSRRDTEALQRKSLLKIVPGAENTKEAKIVLEVEGEEVTVAKFLEIGYFFKGDNLYIRNHVTGSNTLIPKDFHFLKVIQTGLSEYKLAFCNHLGNLCIHSAGR